MRAPYFDHLIEKLVVESIAVTILTYGSIFSNNEVFCKRVNFFYRTWCISTPQRILVPNLASFDSSEERCFPFKDEGIFPMSWKPLELDLNHGLLQLRPGLHTIIVILHMLV